MSKVELTLYVEEETAEVLEGVTEASRDRSDMWDMSRSEAGREFLQNGIDNLGRNPDLAELVDDLDLQLYRKQKKQDRLEKRGRIVDMAEGWRGRVHSRLNKRLAGPEPYDPDGVEELAEMYFEEVTNWEDDEAKHAEHREWLDEKIQTYRDAYRAKQVVPDEAFQHFEDVERGADLLRLRDHFDDVIADVARVAEAESYDVDAIYRRLAGDYAVDEDTIRLVVDELTGEDVDTRRALKSGDGILDAVDRERLDSWGGDSTALPESDEEITGGTGDEVDVDIVEVADAPDEDIDPEDVAREAAIEAAEDALAAGLEDEELLFQVGQVASTQAEINAAIEAARNRRGDADE